MRSCCSHTNHISGRDLKILGRRPALHCQRRVTSLQISDATRPVSRAIPKANISAQPLLIESFLISFMKNVMRTPLLTIALGLSLCTYSTAQGNKSRTESNASERHDATVLSEDQIVDGLRQALELAAGRAIALTGKPDGFLDNEAIRILLPPKLQSVGKAMRLIGEGDTVDDLEIGMNRAAERATPQAKQIFLDAAKKITFRDARHILFGGDTAASEYFEHTCSDDLSTAFTPIVHAALQRVGVLKKYDHVIKTAPGGNAIANEFDLDKYVVGKTLDGIFYELGQEEIKIRTSPAAQSTPLLKEVFVRK